ncbi:polyhydroxyalkanoate depolymerase [Nitrospirillum viridazoti Y2]|uniref:Polyhydroxyalkanoate depolymerase n=1 Tax=Nitrospirillum amazonense TaxID=28077 RepID=A0A560HMB9_9PROT|nr:polyhydroxyalkanoate depolymerase [Nitrospirillum amazonense]EGY00654.1 polyhydroxyalkanoate depolymerase [Nitrospirillum amazonense Y2]TWB47687.1 polyhydroxyalkanoate depolymerase [Nitrospirillum amazonense]
MPEPLPSPRDRPASQDAFTEEVLRDGAFARLMRFHTGGDLAPASRPRALLVAPLSGVNPRLMYDMVADLAGETDLHLLEWRDAAEVPAACGGFGLAHCLSQVLEAIQDLGEEVDLIGLCQSALPALAATALLASSRTLPRPRSLVLIGGKIDPRTNPTPGDRFATGHSLDWFRKNAITAVGPGRPGAGRPVYARATQEKVLWSYLNRHLADGCDILAKMLHDDGLDPAEHPFLPSLGALIDVPAEFFLDVIGTVYHARALPQGRMTWFDLPVDTSAVRDTALLTIEGGRDDIAGPGQCRVAHDLCPGIPQDRRGHRLLPGAGHFDLFHGTVWRGQVRPVVSEFLHQRP